MSICIMTYDILSDWINSNLTFNYLLHYIIQWQCLVIHSIFFVGKCFLFKPVVFYKKLSTFSSLVVEKCKLFTLIFWTSTSGITLPISSNCAAFSTQYESWEHDLSNDVFENGCSPICQNVGVPKEAQWGALTLVRTWSVMLTEKGSREMFATSDSSFLWNIFTIIKRS